MQYQRLSRAVAEFDLPCHTQNYKPNKGIAEYDLLYKYIHIYWNINISLFSSTQSFICNFFLYLLIDFSKSMPRYSDAHLSSDCLSLIYLSFDIQNINSTVFSYIDRHFLPKVWTSVFSCYFWSDCSFLTNNFCLKIRMSFFAIQNIKLQKSFQIVTLRM